MINELIFERNEPTASSTDRLLHLVSVNVNDSIKCLEANHILNRFFFQSDGSAYSKEIMLQTMRKK